MSGIVPVPHRSYYASLIMKFFDKCKQDQAEILALQHIILQRTADAHKFLKEFTKISKEIATECKGLVPDKDKFNHRELIDEVKQFLTKALQDIEILRTRLTGTAAIGPEYNAGTKMLTTALQTFDIKRFDLYTESHLVLYKEYIEHATEVSKSKATEMVKQSTETMDLINGAFGAGMENAKRLKRKVRYALAITDPKDVV